MIPHFIIIFWEKNCVLLVLRSELLRFEIFLYLPISAYQIDNLKNIRISWISAATMHRDKLMDLCPRKTGFFLSWC